MLVDPILAEFDPGSMSAFLTSVIGKGREPKRLDKGVWQWPHWNPDIDLGVRPLIDAEFDYDAPVSTYGVCDSPEQLLARYDFEADPRTLFISMVEIRRENEPPDGGWRYHKWGDYIGTQNPQQEYLYDDKHIERVWTYHVYELVEGQYEP